MELESFNGGIRVLIFPLDMDRASEFAYSVNALGFSVVGASSEMAEKDALNHSIESYHHLPYVTDPKFDQVFSALLEIEKITHVFSPHGVVWNHLYRNRNKLLKAGNIHLCEPSPYKEEWLRQAVARRWATETMQDGFVQDLKTDKRLSTQRLRFNELVALYCQFTRIPGQSDVDKLRILVHVLSLVPPGDAVEIGSFQGRSAFAIGWLARRYDIGNLVCVDPWNAGKVEDQGQKAAMVDTGTQEGDSVINFEHVFQIFLSSVSLLDNVGFIRDVSVRAADTYAVAGRAGYLPGNEQPELPLVGKITFLHIDGNHRYDHVRQDVDSWLPFVTAGGWVALDDYVWAFGDGPKRVGDDLLLTNQFDTAFVAGDTLFLRKI